MNVPRWIQKSETVWNYTLAKESPNIVGRAVKSEANETWFWEAFPYQGRWGFADSGVDAKTEVEKHYLPLT